MDKLLKNINNIRDKINEEVASVRERDPAARSTAEILLTYSGLHAVLLHRVAHKLHQNKCYVTARIISQLGKFFTGIEIHPGATIGKALFIDHRTGALIGETAEIGDNCILYQGVTLGGTGKGKGKRHPTLGNNVMVGCGAKVLGPFKIGDNVKIAANSVVLHEIPENCTAVGAPARVVRRDGVKVTQDLDHVHIPDPVAQELCRQQVRIDQLERELNALKNK